MKKLKKGTIIVTGGCGYIGSHTSVEILENTDYEVVSIDNLSNSSPKVIDYIENITGYRMTNYAIDLCDLEETLRVFQSIENIVGVIHFAALKCVPESVSEPIKYYHNNLESLTNVLTACQKFDIASFIFSSSCSVYGDVTELPVSESTIRNNAQSPYARTKQIGEDIIEDFTRINDIKCIALRYFNPVGAHISGKLGELQINKPNNLVPIITRTAAGLQDSMTVFGGELATRDGSCIRDYVHVCDIASAHVLSLQYLINKENEKQYEIFNLGSGNGVSVFEAILAFEKNTNQKLNYNIGKQRDGDVIAIYSNSENAINKLKWKIKYGIDDMMNSAWKWQQFLLENNNGHL